MKKYVLLLIIAIFPFAFASAATAPQVVSLETTVEGNVIKYNGEMEDGSFAVVCKLVDKDDKEVQDFSSAVDNHKFSGSFTVETAGDYTVRCANYEGGIVKGATVTIDSIAEAQSNPPTGDSIYTYGIIAGIALIGIGIVVVILTKKKK